MGNALRFSQNHDLMPKAGKRLEVTMTINNNINLNNAGLSNYKIIILKSTCYPG